jgi:hypothetical protein
MPVQLTLNKGRVPVKVFTKDIDPDAIQQLLNVAHYRSCIATSRRCPMFIMESVQRSAV